MSTTRVDGLYRDHRAIDEALNSTNETSLAISASDVFRKALLLGAASRFEQLVSALVGEFAAKCSGGDERLCSLVQQKAIDRQFHTYVDWERSNANKFFKLFGDKFLDAMKKKTAGDVNFASNTRAFIEIVSERNRLVHQDFANYSLEKTTEEIYQLYRNGLKFIEELRRDLFDPAAFPAAAD
jgi:hypothetical protein